MRILFRYNYKPTTRIAYFCSDFVNIQNIKMMLLLICLTYMRVNVKYKDQKRYNF